MTLDLNAISELPIKIEKLSAQIANLHQAIIKKPESKHWLSRKEYAAKHNISVSMVDKLRRDQKLEFKKVGSRTLIKND